MKPRLSSLAFLLTAVVLLSGCLTSPNAFFRDEDVFQDDRIVGDYSDSKDETGTLVRKDPDQKGHYLIRYYEVGNTGRWVDLTATLFKAGTNNFVDLVPHGDFSMDPLPNVPPGGIDLIRNITHQPLHIVARISITDDGLAFSLPQKRPFWEFVQHHPAFTNYVRENSVLVLPHTSKELRSLLEKEGDALFPKPTDFKKPKPIPH